jgi:hypothetical protein
MDLPVVISTLQHTDRWIGAPLCAILTFVRRIFEAAGPAEPRQVRGILCGKFAEQGSAVLAFLQSAARREWPQARTSTQWPAHLPR